MPTAARELSHVAEAAKYSRDVTAGKIPACQWVTKSCQRQQADLERWKTDGPWEWDAQAAEYLVDFIERFPHIRGVWARAHSRILLQPWQKFILTTVFGWKSREFGTRRFRTVYIEVPRKNGKSSLTSAVGLYLLAADDEPGAHVVSAAAAREQARIVFNDAQHMARREKGFLRRFGVEVLAHTIIQLETASKFESLSAEDSNLDGLNIHGALIDELHAHRTRGIWDVLGTATGSRAQPLIWAITTAGLSRASVCYDQHTHVKNILNGAVADESYFGIIYSIDDGDDPFEEASWQKANPNYGVSKYPEAMRTEAAQAQSMPSAQTAFFTKHLNVWVNAGHQWLDIRHWAKCANPGLTPEDCVGRPCWIGVDLGTRSDIAAVVLLFPPDKSTPKWRCFGRYYLPSEVVEQSGNSHYQGWDRAGLLVSTEGNATDFNYILDDIMLWVDQFDIRELVYDKWKNVSLVNAFTLRGFTPPQVELRQSPAVMSPAMIALESLVLSQDIEHDGDPILTWMMSNVVAHSVQRMGDFLYPVKESPDKKIDGVLALLMALDRAQRAAPASDSETPGLWII